MWVEAILTKDDLSLVIAELCPVTLALGDGAPGEQYLTLLNPTDVSLVPERGLRVTCEAEVRWPVLGVEVPVRVASITLLLSVVLTPDLGEEVLAFKPELEAMDLSWVPSVVDAAIVEKINQELSRKQVELTWHFTKTLSHLFALPRLLSPVNALDVRVAWGKVRVSEEAMVMAVSLHTHVLREEAGEQALARVSSAPIAPSASKRPSAFPRNTIGVPFPLAIAGAAALSGMAAVVAFGATSSLWRFAVGRA